MPKINKLTTAQLNDDDTMRIDVIVRKYTRDMLQTYADRKNIRLGIAAGMLLERLTSSREFEKEFFGLFKSHNSRR